MLKLLLLLGAVSFACAEDEGFELNIVHYNDFHARFVETSPLGSVCNPENAPCIGGFARLTTAIRAAFEREPQSVLLNAGDSFQGTIWYNILRWNVTKEFMNMLPHDAHALGNHEFDNGIEGLVPYLKGLNDKVVTANINDEDEPTIQGLYEKSIIIERNGKQIGIIGVIVSNTDTLAHTGQLKFLDEIETVKAEAEKLNEQGVDIIIVLSHCGLEVDQDIALNGGPYIDIVVGAHTHSLLYNGEAPDSQFVVKGEYPIVVKQTDTERPVLVVQAAAHSAYLGEIKLYFDSEGNLLDWAGNPHYMSNDIEQAADVLEKIEQYLPIIEEMSLEEVGSSMVQLDSNCRCAECNFGNLICDAFMHSVLDRAENGSWHYAHFCIINRGNIRSSISAGKITFESVIVSNPFENNVEVWELKGEYIWDMLEYAVANVPYAGARMIQVSGLRATIDGAQPAYSRVQNVTIRCIECDVPRYEPLQLDKYYKVMAQSFIGEGGDGFTMIGDNRRNVEVVGVDYDILMNYIRTQSPVFAEVEGRMQISNACLV